MFAFDLFFALNTDISEQDMAQKSLLYNQSTNETPTIEAGQHCKFLELVLFYINFNYVHTCLRYRSSPIFWQVLSFGLCVVFCRSLLDLLSFFCLSLCCLSFFYLRLLITPLVSSSFSVLFLLSLYCLSFFYLQLLITPLVSLSFSLPFSFWHCIVCRSSIYSFWLPLWYL